ncbi:MAG: DUF5701 family protein [Weeksellaceae bacterium]
MLDLQLEFDRQTQNLLDKQYPTLAGLSTEAFLKHITPLKSLIENIDLPAIDLDYGTLPFMIVVKNDLVSAEKAMEAIDREGKNGVINMTPVSPKDFNPIANLGLPDAPVYLLLDIDRGKETLNIAPDKALEILQAENRTPLTIDEGIAIITHFPDYLMKNNCFSLLGSRDTGKHVPAIWISDHRPKLGWCWNGNPHTWLGSASAKQRIS